MIAVAFSPRLISSQTKRTGTIVADAPSHTHSCESGPRLRCSSEGIRTLLSVATRVATDFFSDSSSAVSSSSAAAAARSFSNSVSDSEPIGASSS